MNYFRILLLSFLLFFVFPFTFAGDAQAARGRVQIINNNVVADNGVPLRGESVFLTDEAGSTTGNYTLSYLYNESYWRALRDDFRLNTVRLFAMRPPQNWNADLGEDCWPWSNPPYRCYPLDYEVGFEKTALEIIDDAVDMAEALGMYIIIDYHPVLGHNEADAIAWWTQIAPRYKDRTHVIYELANEAKGTASFERNVYDTIRSSAPDTHIILWSFASLSSGRRFEVDNAQSNPSTAVSYANASVGYHPYGSYDPQDLIDLRNYYPVFNTEMGSSKRTMTSVSETAGVSWVWLAGAKTHGVGAPDAFLPNEVTWPADPAAVDMGDVPTPTPTLPGDINNDGIVNILDYTLLSNAFGTSDPDADINNDGIVSILDYIILSNNFGRTSP